MIHHHLQNNPEERGCTARFAVCLCVGSLLAWSAASAQETSPAPPPALVRVGQVQIESWQVRREVVGRLQEVRRTVVAAEQPGLVVEIPVDEGDAVVQQKTVLARIDDIWARIELDMAKAQHQQANAAVAVAEADIEQSHRDRVYLEGLLVTRSAKPKEVADANTAETRTHAGLDHARAGVMLAETSLKLSQERLRRLTVFAPFDGVVVRKMTEVGDWVNQGDPVAEIISRGMIDAVVDVPEAVINRIEIGSVVEVYIEPLAEAVSGRVVVINPSGSPMARTFPVKARLDDQQGRLKPGMSVLARIPTSESTRVLTVPRDAVHRSTSGMVVWAEFGGVAVPVAVEVMFGQGDRYAVRQIERPDDPDGPMLTEQTNVVVEGAERLFPQRPLLITREAGSG